MKWTKTLIPTLREPPAEAEILSHKLLLRAGLIRKLAGGVYTFLPLGLRALHKVEQIVREEMDRAGAIEVLMPALQPPEIWQQSGRVRNRARRAVQGQGQRATANGFSARPPRKSSPRSPPAKSIPTGSCQKTFTRSASSSATKSARASA